MIVELIEEKHQTVDQNKEDRNGGRMTPADSACQRDEQHNLGYLLFNLFALIWSISNMIGKDNLFLE